VDVPHDVGQIKAALVGLVSGDEVHVSPINGSNDPYDSFDMIRGVAVIAVSGRPKIAPLNGGSATAYAVSFPSNSNTGTVLQGFTILGSSSMTGTHIVEVRNDGLVKDCIIDANGSTVTNLVGLYHTGTSSTHSLDITIKMDGTSQTRYGMYLDASIFACTGGSISIHGGGSNYGIYCPSGVGTGGPIIEKMFVKVPNGTGIYYNITATGPSSIRNCTVDSTTGYGIKVDSSTGHTNVTNCIATNAAGNQKEISGNVGYVKDCIASPTGFEENGHTPGGNPTLYGDNTDDPLYCDPDHGEYTLRVDSYGNPDVALNVSGDTGTLLALGAYPVACAYGTLARTGLVWGGADTDEGTLNVTGDWTIGSSKTFTLDYGGILSMSDSDARASTGSYSGKDEILVSGTFNVSGQSSTKAKIQAASTPTEGKWGTISFLNGGGGTVSYCEIRDAVVGITAPYSNAITVSNCLLEGNQNFDIYIKHGAYSATHFTDNTVNVGDGSGIKLVTTSPGSDQVVTDNTVTLNSDSDAGILLWGEGSTTALSGNSVSGAYAGYGFEIGGKGNWILQTNQIQNCGIGIYEHQGSGPSDLTGLFGGTGAGYGNTITYNTVGVSADSSKAKPQLKYNDINNNTYGVRARNSAAPDLGTAQGKNTFLSNTTYCIQNLNSSGTIMAKGNYFGSVSCDTSIAPGCTSGSVNTSGRLCSDPSGVMLAIAPLEGKPFALLGVAPNPTSNASRIEFSLFTANSVRARIFDLAGRMVRDLGVHQLTPGVHHIDWDGRDADARNVSSGIYLAKVTGEQGMNLTAKVLVAH
jgi:hypothetical protein